MRSALDDVGSLPTTVLLDLLVSGTTGRAAAAELAFAFPMVPREFIDAARAELARRIDA